MGKPEKNIREYIVAGGLAGIVARTCIAPVERVKIMFQVSRGTQYNGGYVQYLPKILRNEGECCRMSMCHCFLGRSCTGAILSLRSTYVRA